jgi:pullulanase/glycogen debranching enzyme
MSWLSRYKKAVRLYSPNSEEVSLIIEELNQRWPMKRDAHGDWTVKPDIPPYKLNNLCYYFLVKEGGRVRKVADPMAHRFKRVDGRYMSLFSDDGHTFDGHTFLNRRYHAPSIESIVIYEAHLPALTRHSSAVLEEEQTRGTYLGAASDFILNHLQRLKVAVEFLPLHFHDKRLGQDWGYYSVAYNAMRTDYAVDKERANSEVKMLVDAMHGREIPVILDVVFNHGAELWVKAWGKNIVYRKLKDGGFCQGSGCGETVQTENRHIRKVIIETLIELVKAYGFDGFRFDLGALHDKKTILEIDRCLPRRTYLIAEPWALGGNQWGKAEMSGEFAHTRWAIWNDDFREPARTFIQGNGDHVNRDYLMRAMVGSHVKDGGWAIRPQQSINYISCHDGKTLADLVAGDKHRVFLGLFILLTSQGIPMLGEGSEMLYTKHGHENSYDRPELNQLDWGNAAQHSDLVEAVASLISLRKQLSHFRYRRHLKVNDHKHDNWDLDWIYPTGYPHNDNVNAIAYIIRPPWRYQLWHRERHPLLILLNGSYNGVDFQLPNGQWKPIVDGLHLAVNATGIDSVPKAEEHYHVHPGTCAMLVPVT